MANQYNLNVSGKIIVVFGEECVNLGSYDLGHIALDILQSPQDWIVCADGFFCRRDGGRFYSKDVVGQRLTKNEYKILQR